MSLGTYAVLVDKPWFEKLPAEQRKAISDSIAEIAQRQWKEAIEEDKVLIKKMVSQGAVFHTILGALSSAIAERKASPAVITIVGLCD